MDKRGVIWARVSSEEQKGGYSLDAQERLLKDFAKNKGIEVVKGGIFRVAEQASTAAKRKEFQRMLALIQKEHIPFLVAEKTDRIVRNLADPAALNDLMNKGLTVHLVRESLDMDKDSPPHVGLTFGIMCAVAAYIAKLIGREARKGMKEKAEQGGLPYKCPVGYLPVQDPSDPKGKKRTVVKDPERAPLVAWAFEQYAKGRHSLETLSAELNRKGLTTRPSATTPARPISVPTLAKVLRNRFYYGDVLWSGGLYEGKHEPLISRELFDQVQLALTEKTRYIKPAAKKWFPFKAFLKCGYCGCQITAEEQQGKGGKGRWIYYHCSYGRRVKDPNWYQKHFGRKWCKQPRYPQRIIDQMIRKELGTLAINEDMAVKIRQRLKQTHAKETEAERRELQRLQSEQTKLTNRLDAMQNYLYDGTITKEEYLKKKSEALSALTSVQAELDRLTHTNLAYKEQGARIIEMMQGFKSVYEAADWQGKAKILNVVLDRIILKGDDTFFQWTPQFGTLFTLAPIINKKAKGE